MKPNLSSVLPWRWIDAGALMPRGFGIAYRNPFRDEVLVVPVPFNLLVSMLRRIWIAFKCGFPNDTIERTYRRGWDRGEAATLDRGVDDPSWIIHEARRRRNRLRCRCNDPPAWKSSCHRHGPIPSAPDMDTCPCGMCRGERAQPTQDSGDREIQCSTREQ